MQKAQTRKFLVLFLTGWRAGLVFLLVLLAGCGALATPPAPTPVRNLRFGAVTSGDPARAGSLDSLTQAGQALRLDLTVTEPADRYNPQMVERVVPWLEIGVTEQLRGLQAIRWLADKNPDLAGAYQAKIPAGQEILLVRLVIRNLLSETYSSYAVDQQVDLNWFSLIGDRRVLVPAAFADNFSKFPSRIPPPGSWKEVALGFAVHSDEQRFILLVGPGSSQPCAQGVTSPDGAETFRLPQLGRWGMALTPEAAELLSTPEPVEDNSVGLAREHPARVGEVVIANGWKAELLEVRAGLPEMPQNNPYLGWINQFIKSIKGPTPYTPHAAHLRMSFHGQAESAPGCFPLVFLGKDARSGMLTLLGKNLEEPFVSGGAQYVLEADTFGEMVGWATPGAELDLWYIWLEQGGGEKVEGLQFSSDAGLGTGGPGGVRYLDLRTE